MRKFVTSKFQKIKALYTRYERLSMPITLIGGFLFDYITFASIQIQTTFLLMLGYWIVATAAILLGAWSPYGGSPEGRQPQKPLHPTIAYIKLFSPLIVQFCFGSLLGTSLIFYWFAGVFSISWPIMAILAGLLVGNEVFKNYFLSSTVQTSVHFFGTFSLLSAFFPYAFNSLDPWLFILAGGTSIIIFYLFTRGLYKIRNFLPLQKRRLFLALLIITLTMNGLYFLNIIPPIPLSLKEAGMYHSLKNVGGVYHMQGEFENFWQKIIPGQTVQVSPGERIYCYTAIFAPTALDVSIIHDWQYYDTVKKDWVSKSKLSFDITGGRKEGYKGYSYNSHVTPGSWRIYVKNQRGQVLGNITFTVQKATGEVKLQETIR